jgi:hypothetical protein
VCLPEEATACEVEGRAGAAAEDDGEPSFCGTDEIVTACFLLLFGASFRPHMMESPRRIGTLFFFLPFAFFFACAAALPWEVIVGAREEKFVHVEWRRSAEEKTLHWQLQSP